MNTIVIGNYNNYYNRLHKESFSTAQSYSENGMDNTHVFNDINFNRADNVNTNLTINLNPLDTDFDDNINPDYLLVCTSASGHPVVSRWFILEAQWNRDHQLLLTLRRDLVTDFWDDYKNNDFYCEKGAIPNGFDVLKYTSEGMTFNSILTKRIPLKQTSGQTGRYIIGYIDRSWDGGTIYNGTIKNEYEKWEDFPLYPYVKADSGMLVDYSTATYGAMLYAVQAIDPSPLPYAQGITKKYAIRVSGSGGPTDSTWTSGVSVVGCNNIPSAVTGSIIAQNLDDDEKAYMVDRIKGHLEPNYPAYSSEIEDWRGKYIKVGSKVYVINIDSESEDLFVTNPAGMFYSYVINAFQRAITDQGSTETVWATDAIGEAISGYCRCIMHNVTVTEVSGIEIPGSRTHAGNLPYDIFVLNDNEISRRFVSNFATQYTGGHVVYDIQILPFKPNSVSSGISIGGGNTIEWATSDSISGHFYHEAVKSYSSSDPIVERVNYKKGSNLDTCRIYSPDGANCWEFNPAKIGGVSADSIRYEVTFAPIRTYIHIFPHFGGIYGSINKGTSETATAESRGILCTGDYSIPYSTNNWSTYQLQNSAYQLAHDRQIENMSVMQNAERMQENLGIVAGTASGAIGGAMSGAMVGGAYGAVAGGIVGGVASLAGGLAGREVNEQLRKEEISYVEDMFGYQLQNIRAQAQPLAHSNYLTVGVAYFPYVEFYTSTLTEEDIFEDRLRINGWSLGIVTTLSAMKTACSPAGSPTGFCKGRLVRYGGEEDSHLVNELNAELQRGVRFK